MTTTHHDADFEMLVDAIRQRLRFGQDFDEISEDLAVAFSAEEIYLAYHGAKILLQAEASDKRGDYEAYMKKPDSWPHAR